MLSNCMLDEIQVRATYSKAILVAVTLEISVKEGYL